MSDDAIAVRPGEELDRAALLAYLRAELDGSLTDADLEIAQFPGGHSNLTYLLRLPGREVVLRRPPHGSQVATAHDMGREVRVLTRLAPIYPKAPLPLAACDDAGVLGAPFYLMERRRGVVLRRTPPAGIALDPPLCRALGGSLIDALVELHAVPLSITGLDQLGKPEGYVARQVRGWTERYAAARTDEVAEVERVAAWLAAAQPSSPPAALIHNDFKLDNLVLDPAALDRVTAVLDWEMATIGDPLMDLGTALAYWVEADDPPAMHELMFGPTTLPGMPRRAALAARYAEGSGRSLARLPFYYVFGLFKTAVVLQQIYARWARGATADPRFARFLPAVRALVGQAARAIDRDAI